MLGWVLGAITIGCVCNALKDKRDEKNNSLYYQSKCQYLEYQNYNLRKENNYLRITFNNHMTLLADYDKINEYAKDLGYKGAVDFFYYLSEYHDSRFEHFARFLNRVRHIRIDVAHHGITYDIDQGFMRKLRACVEVCREHSRLPYGRRLYLD